MDKYRNLTQAAKVLENPFFVQEKHNNIKVYLVDEDEYYKTESSGTILCQVLEYEETNSEIVYQIKTPEMFIPLPRTSLEALFTT